MSKSSLNLLLVAALASACTTTTHSRTYHGDPVSPTLAVPTRAWRAAPAGMESVTLGYVVQFDPTGDDRDGYWSVRNAYHQDLGLVDALGRAWRFEPHVEGAHLLGSGTVAEGVGSILSAPPVTLIDVGLDSLRAAGPSETNARGSGTALEPSANPADEARRDGRGTNARNASIRAGRGPKKDLERPPYPPALST